MISFLKKYGAVHPLLFGIFPVLFLFAQNANELILDDVLDVLWVVAAVSLGLTILLALVLRNIRKGALLASLSLLLFFSFGHVNNKLPGFSIPFGVSEITSAMILLVFWMVLLTVGGWFIVRKRRDPGTITTALNVIAAVLVLNQLWTAGKVLANRPEPIISPEVTVLECQPPEKLPDIYYIVCDAYTRADVLEQVFGHDNSSFLDELRGMGFYIVDRACSNYGVTAMSLASTLNFNFLDSLEGLEPSSSDRTLMAGCIKKNKVITTLKTLGYNIVAFETGHRNTEMTEADVYYGGDRLIDEFEHLLLSTTPVLLFAPVRRTAYGEHRDRILAVLDKLPYVRATVSPKFVFAHILCPHPPFVFDAEGNYLDPEWPFTLNDPVIHEKEGGTPEMYRASYAGQLSYLNTRLAAIARTIIEESTDVPPIIIFQGDHGTRSRAHREGWNDDFFKEEYSILNALYLPGVDSSLLHDRLSPVNTFRLILNEYLGCAHDMLPDQSFAADWGKPYELWPVTRKCLTWGPPEQVMYDGLNPSSGLEVGEHGLLVTFSGLQHHDRLEIIYAGSGYDLYFCKDEAVIATAVANDTPEAKTIAVPNEAVLNGFDNILLLPIGAAEDHRIESLRLM